MSELLTLEGYTGTGVYEHEKGGAARHNVRLMFTYSSIVTATNNFSKEYKLGQGGFGPVYKVHETFHFVHASGLRRTPCPDDFC